MTPDELPPRTTKLDGILGDNYARMLGLIDD
jgi:hypothetical protein